MGIFRSTPKHPVREPDPAWNPDTWATRVPFTHLENFAEVFRAGWENRDQLSYAWRILNDGVCDGCALGTSGMSDWTVEGIHLCNVRLRLLRLNTLPAADPSVFRDVASLKTRTSRELRELGRLPHPMIRRRGDRGFEPISWEDALDLIAGRIDRDQPDRTYLYLTSRGIPNETYYVAQKAMRVIGTNNVDNAARVCHSPSTVALKEAIGVGATTCSYRDLIGTDLITFFGSNVAKNQPVLMKYLYHAKKAGTKIVTVNPYREPGMDAYWVPSDLESAMFGTKISDHFVQVTSGGDRAFLHGTLKALNEAGAIDRSFIDAHTHGWDDLQAVLEATSWETIEREAGVGRSEIEQYADLVAKAERAVFVWGMGITQHADGEDNVRAIVDLALSRGFIGREGCGVMPIRGHSGVQGGAEMGAYTNVLPGGTALTEASAATLSSAYGFNVPSQPGITTPAMLAAARRGEIDVLLAVGGNFREVMPDPAASDDALGNVPLRVHIDIVPSSQMLTDPADTVLLLPTMTRYEIPGGVTETSTERRIIYNPEIPGPRIDAAMPEWTILSELARRVRPERAHAVAWHDTHAIRQEIANVVPAYRGIETLTKKGDQVQYGGEHLCANGVFATSDGRARFHPKALTAQTHEPGTLRIVTRRGKQFNSIVHDDVDSLNKLRRDAILVAAEDAAERGLRDGDAIEVVSDHGTLRGTLRVVDTAAGAVQVHWPEANVLLDPDHRGGASDIPAYKHGWATLRAAGRNPQPPSGQPVPRV